MENGVITKVEGGSEADVMRAWLANCDDPTIYKLCHYSIGLNPQAGISGRMIEDERKFGRRSISVSATRTRTSAARWD